MNEANIYLRGVGDVMVIFVVIYFAFGRRSADDRLAMFWNFVGDVWEVYLQCVWRWFGTSGGAEPPVMQ